MVDNVRRECIMSMYEIYPLSRKLVFDTFDKKKYDITRTQQIIMLSLCIEGTLTMSQLASKINTSNEQATRAVAQLVDKGFVIRMQNPDNRRGTRIPIVPLQIPSTIDCIRLPTCKKYSNMRKVILCNDCYWHLTALQETKHNI